MSGILSNGVANFFTRATGYQIDFSNTLNVITKKSLGEYTSKEVLDRAYIYGAMVVGGVGGYLVKRLAAQESSGSYAALAIALGAIGGFTVSHNKILAEKKAHRMAVQVDIDSNVTELKSDFARLVSSQSAAPQLQANLAGCIDAVLKQESMDGTGSVKAMATLCLRRSAIQALRAKVEAQLEQGSKSSDLEFWQREPQEILQDLGLAEQTAQYRP